jgi:hypothetical protein
MALLSCGCEGKGGRGNEGIVWCCIIFMMKETRSGDDELAHIEIGE